MTPSLAGSDGLNLSASLREFSNDYLLSNLQSLLGAARANVCLPNIFSSKTFMRESEMTFFGVRCSHVLHGHRQ